MTDINIVENLLGRPITFSERIGEGANSRVYRIEGSDAKSYAAKFYFTQNTDQRNRLETEFSILSFLDDNNLSCVPYPVAMNQEHNCAVYEYIEGVKISSKDVTIHHIDEVIGFLKHLKIFAAQKEIHDFPLASEACFSIEQVAENIQCRLERLELPAKEYEDLRDFLVIDFIPFFEVIIQWCKAQPVAFDEEISQNERTLSPSDYGFHNALCNKQGKLIFLDFEYFGWDDPAKMISDFLLHPAMELSLDLKKRFVQGMQSVFQDNPELLQRVVTVFPLFGLKWCLIFLNEFIPNDWQRRQFAEVEVLDEHQRQKAQLFKAQEMLKHMKEIYRDFPYN